MWNLILIFITAMIANSCGPRYVDYFPCHDDGTFKPAVVILPIKNQTQSILSTDAPEKIETSLRHDAMSSGQLYLYMQDEISADIEKLGSRNYFDSESLFSETFCDADFVVVAELTEQSLIPYSQCRPTNDCIIIAQPCDLLFTLKMRIKVIDIRSRCPRTVLQEVFTRGYFIPNPNGNSGDLCNAYRRFGFSLNKRLEQVIRGAY